MCEDFVCSWVSEVLSIRVWDFATISYATVMWFHSLHYDTFLVNLHRRHFCRWLQQITKIYCSEPTCGRWFLLKQIAYFVKRHEFFFKTKNIFQKFSNINQKWDVLYDYCVVCRGFRVSTHLLIDFVEIYISIIIQDWKIRKWNGEREKNKKQPVIGFRCDIACAMLESN